MRPTRRWPDGPTRVLSDHVLRPGLPPQLRDVHDFPPLIFVRGRLRPDGRGDTRDGKIVLMTIDGEQRISVGVSSSMLADTMLAFGAANAVQLDGGGSSEMVVKGDVVNSPSDGSERAIGDALVWVP